MSEIGKNPPRISKLEILQLRRHSPKSKCQVGMQFHGGFFLPQPMTSLESRYPRFLKQKSNEIDRSFVFMHIYIFILQVRSKNHLKETQLRRKKKASSANRWCFLYKFMVSYYHMIHFSYKPAYFPMLSPNLLELKPSHKRDPILPATWDTPRHPQ